jgi:ribosomal protein S18 acetylase RimI-like enzyme
MSFPTAHGLIFEPAELADEARVKRVRPPADAAFFVHYNSFWLNRALRDPAVRFMLVRTPRQALVAVVAYGPHVQIDQDPSSRIDDIGEIYHLVVDRRRARQGLGRRIAQALLDRLPDELPGIKAVRVGHHPANARAQRLWESLGFVCIGQKADHETGTADVLLERRLQARV